MKCRQVSDLQEIVFGGRVLTSAVLGYTSKNLGTSVEWSLAACQDEAQCMSPAHSRGDVSTPVI